MKSRFNSVVAGLALLAGISPAAATVFLTSDTNSIVVGQSITFSLAFDPPLQLLIPDGENFLFFAQTGVFFFSGDGQQQSTIGIGPSGGGNITFTYLTPGDYIASASGSVFYGLTHCLGCDPILGTGGRDLLDFSVFENITVSVPEPSTWALMLFGFTGLGFAFRQSRRKVFSPDFS